MIYHLRTLISIIGLLIFFSCTNQKVNIIKTDRNRNSLQGEWMLDSIVGQSEWIQDWVYFTDDTKFWRFTKFNESYIIDKELSWKSDSVFEGNIIKYTIINLDSNHILLDDGTKKLHCIRWMPFDREDIDRFVKADPIKKQINGRWILESSSTKLPLEFPSWCYNLGIGTEFYFKPEGSTEITPVDTSGNLNCRHYGYSIFVSKQTELTLIEGDMVMSYIISKIDSNELILTDKNLLPEIIKLNRKK